MALKADFQDALQTFIYSNLPILMNPANARNVVVSNRIIPTTPSTSTPGTTITVSTPSISAAQAINAGPVLNIPPEIAEAIQYYVLNNFPNIGLPQDIQQIVKNFFANLPPLIPIAPNTVVPITAIPVAPIT